MGDHTENPDIPMISQKFHSTKWNEIPQVINPSRKWTSYFLLLCFFTQNTMDDTNTPYKQLSNHVTSSRDQDFRAQSSFKTHPRDYELHGFNDSTTTHSNKDAMFPSSLATSSLVVGKFGCYGNTKRYIVIATSGVMIVCLLVTAVVFLWIIQNQSEWEFKFSISTCNFESRFHGA